MEFLIFTLVVSLVGFIVYLKYEETYTVKDMIFAFFLFLIPMFNLTCLAYFLGQTKTFKHIESVTVNWMEKTSKKISQLLNKKLK